jgi:hypothetical protein
MQKLTIWENPYWEKKANELDTPFYPSPRLIITKEENGYKLIPFKSLLTGQPM